MTPSIPAVSVALCTYNGASFLAEQLESINAQSRPVDEIIVCDDGSTDGSLAVVERFAEKAQAPVRWSVNPTRLGVTKNFERAISLCAGDVIFLSDQDDVWHPEKVRVLLERMEVSGAALAFSNGRVVGGDGAPLGYRLWDSTWFNADEQRRVRAGDAVPVLLRHAIAAGATLAFAAAYRPLLLPIPDLPAAHDVWITLLLACVGRIEPVDQDLIDYRLHGANSVGIQRYNFAGQVRMARQQLRTGAFAVLGDLHAAGRDRLAGQTRWPASVATLALLEAKVDHSRRRHEMPRRWLPRMRTVWREWRKGNYGRYSYGVKSVLQDLFLR